MKFKQNAHPVDVDITRLENINNARPVRQMRERILPLTIDTPLGSFVQANSDIPQSGRDMTDVNMDIDVIEEEIVPNPATTKEKQWLTWRDSVMPILISAYAKVIGDTDGLALLNGLKKNKVQCSECPRGSSKPMQVLCLYFDQGLRE